MNSIESIYWLLMPIAIIWSIVKGSFLELLVILLTTGFYQLTTRSLPNSLLYGARAPLANSSINPLQEVPPTELLAPSQKKTVSFCYFRNLFSFLILSLITLFYLKNLILAGLCLIQAKLLTDQHCEKPFKLIVLAAHVVPSFVYYELIPSEMIIARNLMIVCSICILISGYLSIKRFQKECQLN